MIIINRKINQNFFFKDFFDVERFDSDQLEIYLPHSTKNVDETLDLDDQPKDLNEKNFLLVNLFRNG